MDEEITIINEKTRNEKIKSFFLENRNLLFSIISVLVILIISFFSYQAYKKGLRASISDKYNSTVIEYKDNKTVHDDFRYVAEIITGAKTNIENGFNMPPFRNNNTPSWDVSNNKKKNTFLSEILSFFWKKKAPRLINTDNKITIKHSVNNIFISSIFSTKNIAANWPNIAVHLIFIKFVSNIVFTNLKIKCLDWQLLMNFLE